MLKNIEKMRDRGLEIQKKWLVPEIYAYEIPLIILKGLGLRSTGEKERSPTSSERKSREKTRYKSVTQSKKNNDTARGKESKSTMAQTIMVTIDNNYDEPIERRA